MTLPGPRDRGHRGCDAGIHGRVGRGVHYGTSPRTFARSSPPSAPHPDSPAGHARPELLVQPEPATIQLDRLIGRGQLGHRLRGIVEPVADRAGEVLLDLGRVA